MEVDMPLNNETKRKMEVDMPLNNETKRKMIPQNNHSVANKKMNFCQNYTLGAFP